MVHSGNQLEAVLRKAVQIFQLNQSGGIECRSQDVHHSGLAMRAASLAVGGLAALPFLDPHSFQHPASGARGVNGSSQKAIAISIMSHKTALIGECLLLSRSLRCSWTGHCEVYDPCALPTASGIGSRVVIVCSGACSVSASRRPWLGMPKLSAGFALPGLLSVYTNLWQSVLRTKAGSDTNDCETQLNTTAVAVLAVDI